jgi:hypothetical protein
LKGKTYFFINIIKNMSLLEQMQNAKKKGETKVNKPKRSRKKKVVEEAWSITICESGENHTGMQIIGERADEGFTIEELKEANIKLQEAGAETMYYNLKELGLKEDEERFNRAEDAVILVIKNGVRVLGVDKVEFRRSMKAIDCDKEYWDVRRGRKLNKRARHNVCFAYMSQEPDIDNKKGRIVNINSQVQLKNVIDNLHLYLGEKARGLIAELNHYYDVSKCGIGFHGDTERRKVICVRLGASFPMNYYWYENSKRVGKRINIPGLKEGDIYIMSDKAGGWDWKLRKNNRLTLRHAAGCSKYTK